MFAHKLQHSFSRDAWFKSPPSNCRSVAPRENLYRVASALYNVGPKIIPTADFPCASLTPPTFYLLMENAKWFYASKYKRIKNIAKYQQKKNIQENLYKLLLYSRIFMLAHKHCIETFCFLTEWIRFSFSHSLYSSYLKENHTLLS